MVLLAIAGTPGVVGAEDGAFDGWARWVSHSGPWRGQTVAFPDRTPRPQVAMRADSVLEALHVHAPAGTPYRTLQAALSAAEQALDELRKADWPLPPPDGGLGRSPGFDIYLSDGTGGAAAGIDGENMITHYDGALTFGLVPRHLPDHMLPACVVSAVAQAALLGSDPAESGKLAAAAGGLFAWLTTGRLGCMDPNTAGQQEPEAGFGDGLPGESGALWLAMLSEREDGGSGRFVRDVWQFARQRSHNTKHLRASPDVWEATEQALANAGESLDDLVVDFALARFFAGQRGPQTATAFSALRSLSAEEAVPVRSRAMLSQLPAHLHPSPGVGLLGTSYALVATDGASDEVQLQVWLRGEPGPRWSLAAVRLDGSGRELGRIVAPARRTPKSFLPIWLSEDTAHVLLAVTHLPANVPDADVPSPPPAQFKLIVDRRGD